MHTVQLCDGNHRNEIIRCVNLYLGEGTTFLFANGGFDLVTQMTSSVNTITFLQTYRNNVRMERAGWSTVKQCSQDSFWATATEQISPALKASSRCF